MFELTSINVICIVRALRRELDNLEPGSLEHLATSQTLNKFENVNLLSLPN